MTKTPKPYHHGDLRNAFLAAAETILETEGMPALTLRAAARAVGVSHTAPQNHFGDLTGLLSELAAEGYQRFSAAIATALAGHADDQKARARATAHAYVGFAKTHPGLFTLMFRGERLDFTRPALREGADKARAVLQAAIGARTGNALLSPEDAAAQGTAMWSLVHGFAVLMLDGRLRGAASALGENFDEFRLLDSVLEQVTVGR